MFGKEARGLVKRPDVSEEPIVLEDESECRGRTDKKENQNFLIYKEIQSTVAKSFVRKGFLIYEEMSKYFPIYEEAVSHI